MNSFRYKYSSINNFMNTISIFNNNNNHQMNYQMTKLGLSYLAQIKIHWYSFNVQPLPSNSKY
jgi:hypothetical protein